MLCKKKLKNKKKRKTSLGAQWRPYQSFELPGWLKECYLTFGTMLHCIMWLLSKQTKDRVSVRTSCPRMLFTPDLDQFCWSLHTIEIGCPGNLFPREVSKIFKCTIGVCPGTKWSNEHYVICFSWNTALMKNSRGNAFLLFTASSSSLQLEKREVIILGYFNVWELLSGYRFVLFVVKVPEVLEAW